MARGNWWIMPVESTFEFVVFDISAPTHPRRAGALVADSSFTLHWISRDPSRDRLGMAAGGPAPVVRLARIDTTAGALRWDERLRERPDRPLGVSCDRKRWHGGAAGGAEPHGAIFSRR
ncbi:hypothetical protein [Gemmatimonas sp.]|uniref:hypothetical protein n=1 Tax=Gemmatimonas sp. TaxID=1962908 RepID=UPI003F72DD35